MSRTYGFSTQFGTDFDRAVDVLTRELKKQGFGVVSDINLQAIFKEKLAVDEGRYRILGVCNPWVGLACIAKSSKGMPREFITGRRRSLDQGANVLIWPLWADCVAKVVLHW